jgi:hypothetical protein
MTTEEGREELERRRVEAVRAVLPEGVPALLSLAHEIELSLHLGYSIAAATTDMDDAVLDLLDSDDPVNQQVAAGLVNARSQTGDWLEHQTTARPTQAARLVLPLEATNDRLDLIEQFTPDNRSTETSRPGPRRRRCCRTARRGPSRAGRLFAAIDAVSLQRACGPGLIREVLMAPAGRESADSIEALRSAQYEVGRLLDSLEEAGTPSRDLADLEWFYLPLLTDERLPRALHQRLASEPDFFAEVISHTYKPDPSTEGTGEAAEEPQEQYQFSEACWHLTRDWRDSLPGAALGVTPDPEAMQEWITKIREELAKRNRAGIASLAIGEALAGRTTDEDGTWPCHAVRVVLEQEQDDNVEDNLAIARLNQRGVTSCGIYDGGRQERALAERYRKTADEIRDEWPRAGKVLDRIIASYEADARREDASAERQVRH